MQRLSKNQKATLEKAIKLELKKRVLWNPQQGPQSVAYDNQADELFYGGQAGGGKTDLEIGLAITQHRKSIIFRREYPQLKDIIDRTRELLSSRGAKFNGQQLVWRNIPGDRMLEFGACQYEQDKEKYKGRPHDLYAFDEVSDFTESQYTFIIGWNRTTIEGQRCRVIAAGNPPTTSEGEWVIKRWAPWLDESYQNKARPGELRWFAVIDGVDTEVAGPQTIDHNGEILFPKSRTFIPASLEDNVYLRDTNYKSVLQNLPEPLRSQLLYGIFKIRHEDNPWQAIPRKWVQLAMERWKSNKKPDIGQTCLGADISRGGDDSTVIAKRYGYWIDPFVLYPGKEIEDGPKAAAAILKEYDNNCSINIDVIGIGSSAFDSLNTSNVNVIGVNFGESSGQYDKSGKLKLRNIRAQCYWRLREALDPDHGDDICLPPDNELLKELCATRWKLTTGGIQIEDKDDIKTRIGHSPDRADALALTFFDSGPPAAVIGSDPEPVLKRRRW